MQRKLIVSGKLSLIGLSIFRFYDVCLSGNNVPCCYLSNGYQYDDLNDLHYTVISHILKNSLLMIIQLLNSKKKKVNYYYYRFIVRFQMGLDFLFITFLLHFFLAWTDSLSISSSAISASTISNHVLFGLTIGLLPPTLNSIHLFTQSSLLFLITFPHHFSSSLFYITCP